MAHFAAILFFLGLLAALGLILELTVRAHWAAIVAALHRESGPKPALRGTAPQPRPGHAAS